MASSADAKAEQPNDTAEEFIYEHIKEAPYQQMEAADKLDDKMLRIFSAASIVIGFLGLSSTSIFGWKAIFFLLPLIPYIVTATYAFRQLNPRSFHRAMRADQLPQHLDKSEENVRRALIKEISQAFRKNDVVLEAKARCVRYALASTSIEVGLVAGALILYRLL